MGNNQNVSTRLLEAAGLTREEVGTALYTSDRHGAADMAVFLSGVLQDLDGAEAQLKATARWVERGCDEVSAFFNDDRVLNSLGVLQAQGPALDRCVGVMAARVDAAEHALQLFKRLYR